jgi:hypothetical protein
MSVNKLYKFESGEYSLNSLSTSNQQELKKIFESIQTQLGRNTTAVRNIYEIIIRGSESKVTNPLGFEIPGSLADARAQAVREYLTINYPTINSNKDVTIKIIKPSLIGNEIYTKGENVNVPKFKKDQYVEIKFQQIIKERTTNACQEGTHTGAATISEIPITNEIWGVALDFPEDFKTGCYEIRMDSFWYPDAMKITFYDQYYSASREEWIPLFASSIQATQENFQDLYKAYKRNPTSELFTYLPIIKAEGIWLNQPTPESPKKINGRNFQLYEYTSSTNIKDAKRRDHFLWGGSTDLEYSIQNYDEIPLYNTKGDLSIYPSGSIKPEIVPVGEIRDKFNNRIRVEASYMRIITIPKTENYKSVTLTVYGYRATTQFSYNTRCLPSCPK